MSNSFKTPQQRKQNSIDILKSNNIPVLEGLPVIESYDEVVLRSKEDTAKRAVALCLVAVYAEGVCAGKNVSENQKFIRSLIDRYEADTFFTEKENSFLNDNMPTIQTAIQFSWQYECYNVLLWALNFIDDLEYPNKICDVPNITKILNQYESFDDFLTATVVRDKEEILDEADLIYRYGWACVDARINNRTIESIDSGVVVERHRALNWFINYMEQEWDEVTTDT